jgi:hypothetical protein
MKKEFARKLFSYIFLFVFFAKMVISVAPLIAVHLDSEIVKAVILQLEIENHSGSGSDQAKDSLNKGEWLSGVHKFNFNRPQIDVAVKRYVVSRNFAIQAFYPSVPTPPPNC